MRPGVLDAAGAERRQRLDGTEYAPAAEFADWLWSGTGNAFLDFSDEDSIYDGDWTPKVVAQLAEQWRVAEGILDRTKALADWLEADPPARFARLLDAVLGRDAHVTYLRLRDHGTRHPPRPARLARPPERCPRRWSRT